MLTDHATESPVKGCQVNWKTCPWLGRTWQPPHFLACFLIQEIPPNFEVLFYRKGNSFVHSSDCYSNFIVYWFRSKFNHPLCDPFPGEEKISLSIRRNPVYLCDLGFRDHCRHAAQWTSCWSDQSWLYRNDSMLISPSADLSLYLQLYWLSEDEDNHNSLVNSYPDGHLDEHRAFWTDWWHLSL